MALSDFLGRHGITRESYMSRAPTGEMLMAGAAQVLEVGVGAAAVGYAEQRYGEQKTTLFMTAQTNADGSVVKDAQGNTQYKSGTGVPLSAAVAIGTVAAAALVPMSPTLRRHILSLGSGFGAGWAFRFGIAKGQAALDKASGAAASSPAPQPPYAQSAAAMAEQAKVKGDLSQVATVHSIVDQGNAIVRQRAAMAGR
jgi:hypothetical protein